MRANRFGGPKGRPAGETEEKPVWGARATCRKRIKCKHKSAAEQWREFLPWEAEAEAAARRTLPAQLAPPAPMGGLAQNRKPCHGRGRTSASVAKSASGGARHSKAAKKSIGRHLWLLALVACCASRTIAAQSDSGQTAAGAQEQVLPRAQLSGKQPSSRLTHFSTPQASCALWPAPVSVHLDSLNAAAAAAAVVAQAAL